MHCQRVHYYTNSHPPLSSVQPPQCSRDYSAVHFLTRTFRNVFRVCVGNAMFACGVRSAREQSLEEACSETEVGRGLLALKPCPLPPRTRPASTQTEPQLEPATTSAGVILPETGQFLLSCSLQLWQQLQRCRQTRARVQVF